MNQPNSQNQNQMDFILLLIKKTIYQLKKHKWWLGILGILGALFWFKASDILLSAQYSARSLLRVEIAEDSFSRTRPDRDEPYSILGIINTRKFLGKVVDSLDLQFVLSGDEFFRQQIFDSIDYKDNGQYGLYEISVNKGRLSVLYTNKSLGIEHKSVLEIAVTPKIQFNDIRLVLNENFLKTHPEFTINTYFAKKEGAIGRISKELNPRLINRNQFIEINYADRDRFLAQDITNAITTLFVEENVEMKTLKTRNLVKNLEEQLQVAEEKLKVAEENLKTLERPHLEALS